MRMRKRSPAERANSQARSAVRRLPRWRSPVGEGAKRPVKAEGRWQMAEAGRLRFRRAQEASRVRAEAGFKATPEPDALPSAIRHLPSEPRFVIQEHSATRL